RSREQCGVVDRLPGRTFLASRRDTHAFNLRGTLACGRQAGRGTAGSQWGCTPGFAHSGGWCNIRCDQSA
ncbi:hypothetical protein ACFC1R_38300, partial [Kitasatospora sp. NPDC056138]|uniref:hypothetical protein n=1 Tax=Kitasatospora sp. NPDC056138 TaxID=3345724 RepID=UPI0035E19EF8